MTRAGQTYDSIPPPPACPSALPFRVVWQTVPESISEGHKVPHMGESLFLLWRSSLAASSNGNVVRTDIDTETGIPQGPRLEDRGPHGRGSRVQELEGSQVSLGPVLLLPQGDIVNPQRITVAELFSSFLGFSQHLPATCTLFLYIFFSTSGTPASPSSGVLMTSVNP